MPGPDLCRMVHGLMLAPRLAPYGAWRLMRGVSGEKEPSPTFARVARPRSAQVSEKREIEVLRFV